VISNEGALYTGRFICGLGVGIEGVVAPMLLAEISPPSMRGQITTLHQLLLTIGILFSAIIGYFFITYVDHGWKYVQAFTGIPALIQCLWWNKLPESPRWLLRQAQTKQDDSYILQAKTVLTNLRGDVGMVEEELLEMRHELESEKETASVSWKEVFGLGRILYIGLALMFFNPLTGINAVIFYSTTIFNFAGFSQDILATILVRLVNVVMTVVSFFLVDRLGRKILLFRGTAVMWVSLLLQGVILLTLNSNEKAQGVIAVMGTLLFICGYAIGFGAVSWVLMNEILPTRVKPKAFSLFVAEAWFWNVIISRETLTVIQALGGGSDNDQEKRGVAILFLIFGVLAIMAWFFIAIFVPETKVQKGNDGSSDDDKVVNARLVLPQGVSVFEDGPDRTATTRTL